ncbi:MAG: PQQ-like beta-propeller repeat protein [Planctomycetes bacterium]|nr:PQQ-like beta-propeller repeat protein [Planctomycetota bacterium]
MTRPKSSFVRVLICLVGVVVTGGVLTALAADSSKKNYLLDWPQWRGPNRDDLSTDTGLLREWPTDGPKLLWKASGLGTGFSSISIAGDRIYTMGERGEDQLVFALSRQDGKELWATVIGPKWKDANYSGPRCTPTVDGNLLYAVGTSGDLICLETATGKTVWKKNFEKDFGGKMMSGWGFSESPLVDGDKLLCTPGAQNAMVAALNKKTGAKIWATEVPSNDAEGKPFLGEGGKDGAAYSSIVNSNSGGVKQYITLVGRGVISVDAKNGKLLWHYNRITNPTAVIPTAIVNGDYVFASSGYKEGGTALLKIARKGTKFEAEEVYYHPGKEMQNHHGGMVMLGDYIFLGHGHNKGIPMCVEWKTGKIVWQVEGRPVGSGSAAVTYADGHMYFRYQDATMALIEASPDGYKLKGTFKIPDSEKPSWPHPVVLGGKLYLREQDALLCYDIKS